MPTIQDRRAAYRKAKEESLRRDENVLEGIKWTVTKTIIERHPTAEFKWATLEGLILLAVQVRLNDYVWSYNFGREVFEASGFHMSLGISYLLEHMELDPLRQMFDS